MSEKWQDYSTGRPKKLYLILMLYFEAVATIMLGILGYSVSLDLYNPFDTFLSAFMNL